MELLLFLVNLFLIVLFVLLYAHVSDMHRQLIQLRTYLARLSGDKAFGGPGELYEGCFVPEALKEKALALLREGKEGEAVGELKIEALMSGETARRYLKSISSE